MAFHLEMVGGSEPGRRIPIWGDRPRIFKIVRQGLDAGVVEVILEDGQCMVRNCSLRPVLVNRQERATASLRDGDELVIGKDVFQVRASDTDAVVRCFFCAGECLPRECWSDGNDHVCATCLASGTGPAPGTVAAPDIEVIDPLPVAPARPISERRRRAISATMPSQSARRPGLLSRISAVFSHRLKRQREELLRQERRDLLEELGRLTLTGGLFGLDEHQLCALQSGRGLNLAPESQSRAALERWRQLRERVSLIDAEITAVRRQLGLGPDPEVLGKLELRSGSRGREERVFATLDAMETQDVVAINGHSGDLSRSITA